MGANVIYRPVWWGVTYAWAHHTAREHSANLVWEPDEPAVQHARRARLTEWYGPTRRLCRV